MRLTTSPPSRAECHEIWECKSPGTLWATTSLLRDCFTFLREVDFVRVIVVFTIVSMVTFKRDEVTGEWRKLHNEELSDLYSLL